MLLFGRLLFDEKLCDQRMGLVVCWLVVVSSIGCQGSRPNCELWSWLGPVRRHIPSECRHTPRARQLQSEERHGNRHSIRLTVTAASVHLTSGSLLCFPQGLSGGACTLLVPLVGALLGRIVSAPGSLVGAPPARLAPPAALVVGASSRLITSCSRPSSSGSCYILDALTLLIVSFRTLLSSSSSTSQTALSMRSLDDVVAPPIFKRRR